LFEYNSTKQIVIITRHWNILTDEQLVTLGKYNIVINTSVSAMDNPNLIEKSLSQYERLKPHCKSVLRVVTADFNEANTIGAQMAEVQRKLLKNQYVIDTVFRPSSKNRLVVDGIINVKKMAFMNSTALISKYHKKAFVGKCSSCIELCGLNVK